jgi:protein-L-isoaspartate O-methyltransferase
MRTDPAERRLFICMPGYSNLTGGAARGFWRASQLPESQVIQTYNQGSLLANNFNGHWAHALTLCHKGHPITYFAMQHSDIGPEDYWVDHLIYEMEEHDLDILGVVAPIKDGRGLTSIAVHDNEGDNWRPKFRLTMSEVFRLPQTFTSKDVGGPLLLNTGLWVCRFSPDWAKKVHFEINDRIVFDRTTDRYLAQVEPEDWYFSRLCHELGLKIGCTRKIKMEHRGESGFPNDKIWGEPFDAVYHDRSQLPADDGFVFPTGIDGWMLAEEGRALAALSYGKRVFEIGSYCGLSTVCMARTASDVVTVDTHDGRGTPEPRNTFNTLMANLWRHGVAEKVTAVVGTADQWTDDRKFDLIFIDGGHDRESVTRDIESSMHLLADGGLLVFHDYGGEHAEVTAAVDDFVSHGGQIVSQVNSLVVVRPPVNIYQEV